ncbi:MAG: cysteine hydrolase [Hyphomicrobiales bacterium]|nr:MAG: cysteine hydrolase [Hyphomicrobiales bacterium]
MNNATTLLELSGADLTPSILQNSTLILIDMQNEYLEGPIAVTESQQAVEKTTVLLAAARKAGTPVIHVVHKGSTGGMFDLTSHRGAIISPLAPLQNEAVVEKKLPNSFAGTNLEVLLKETGRTELILAGFMTHMCVSSTARSAVDHGYRVTIDADCCATRNLPDGTGGKIDANTLHNIALVELSDRFAIIARNHIW